MQANKVPASTIISLVSAVLYGVSPIDLLPDIIPLLGFLDDALVIPVLLVLAFFFWKRKNARPHKVVPDPVIDVTARSRDTNSPQIRQ